LKAILAEPIFARRSEMVARRLEHEDGVKAACGALENLHATIRKL
jgi:hypothetical protein